MTQGAASVSRGEVVGGHYELERVLGQGGMGTVWCAKDLRLGRSVAIKFLSATAALKAKQRERFAREARLASRTRSPHVVQVFADGTTSSGVPYVVMELLDGENLATHIARVSRCTLQQTESILEQVCRGLGAAHAAGLVHRDIKPANIFLSPQPDGGTFVRLLDFGIAKDMDGAPRSLTQPGEVLGTGYYMSPEQLRSPEAVGSATDIWSLGVVLYEMLTGRVPFDADTFPGLAVCVVAGQFPAPSTLRPELPPAIDALVARALQVEPSRRFATAQALFAALARIVRAHTSEVVIKPEVMRALKAKGDATYRMPRHKRIQDFKTQLLRRDGGWRRVGLLLLLLACAVSTLGIALSRWANLESFDESDELDEPLQAPTYAAPEEVPVREAQSPQSPAAHGGDPPVDPAPPVATPNPEALPRTAADVPSSAPLVRSHRARRKLAPTTPEITPNPPASPETKSAPASSDETKYGF